MESGSPASCSVASISSPDAEAPRRTTTMMPMVGGPFSTYQRVPVQRSGVEESFAQTLAHRLASRRAGFVANHPATAAAASSVTHASSIPPAPSGPPQPPAHLPTSWVSLPRVAPMQVHAVRPDRSDSSASEESPQPAVRKLGRLRKAVDVSQQRRGLPQRRRSGGVVVVLSSDDERDDAEDAEAAAALLERVSAAASARRCRSVTSGARSDDEASSTDASRRSALLAQLSPEVASAFRATRTPVDILQRFVDLLRDAKAVHEQLAAGQAATSARGPSGPVALTPATEEQSCSSAIQASSGEARGSGSIWTPAMLFDAFGWRVGGPVMRAPQAAVEDSQAPAVSHAPLSLTRYQLLGVNWMYALYQAHINGILADDMGALSEISEMCDACRAALSSLPTPHFRSGQNCAGLCVHAGALRAEHWSTARRARAPQVDQTTSTKQAS